MKSLSFFLAVIALTLCVPVAALAQKENYFPKKPEKEPVTAAEWYEYARWSNIYEKDEPDKAKQAVNKAIELQPNLTDALHLRGMMKMDAGDYKSALEDFDAVIQFDPNVTNTYMMRAETRLRLDSKDLNGALSDYDLLITQLAARGYRVYGAFTGRSKLRYQKGNLDGALEDLNQALAMGLNSSDTLFYRSLIYLKQGRTDAALADLTLLDAAYQKLIADSKKQHPQFYSEKEDYPADQNPLASLRPKAKNGLPAASLLMPIISGGGGDTRLRFKTLKEKLDPDNWFDPLDSLPITFPLDETSSVIYYFLGQLLELKGEAEQAEKAYTNAIIAAQSNFAAYLKRGQLRLSDGRLEPAIRDFSWVIHYEPKLSTAYVSRGLAILLLNHDALARKDFDLYLKLEPNMRAELEKQIAAAKQKRETASR